MFWLGDSFSLVGCCALPGFSYVCSNRQDLQLEDRVDKISSQLSIYSAGILLNTGHRFGLNVENEAWKLYWYRKSLIRVILSPSTDCTLLHSRVG